MQGNVQSIDALRVLHQAVQELALRFGYIGFDLKTESQRGQEWVAEAMPRYWRGQMQLAERRLQEATDNLAQLQTTFGGRDKPPATEARKRVEQAKRRFQLCQQKLQACKVWNLELQRAADRLQGATSTLQQTAESTLPTAASCLAGWIDTLDRYSENTGMQGPARASEARLDPADKLTEEPSP
jgi:DNA repair exonuclease SbcCD ATPase subunit